MGINTIYLFITHIILAVDVQATWWYFGLSSAGYHVPVKQEATVDCSRRETLDEQQVASCALLSKTMHSVIRKGAALALDECQNQFYDRRWNCSTHQPQEMFGKILDLNSREKAFIYSISSAGVMHAITRACSTGELKSCGCGHSNIPTNEANGEFIWGGCSDNVQYGYRFTRDFVDANENKKIDIGMMNLWNNKAGRKLVKRRMQLLCKCHGVSGSCSSKICWQTVSPFHNIGSLLKKKFDGASKVKFNKRQRSLLPIHADQKKPAKTDLVYLNDSPDFCEFNPEYGSFGTQGRICNRTSPGLDGCDLMCCGRGYYTMVKEIKEDCDCKFFWCCRVECKKCAHRVEENRCN